MIGAIDKILTSSWLQRYTHQNTISRGFGRLANSSYIPRFILHKIIHAFIRHYQIDMEEYNYDISTARCFNEFFSRPLKPGRRPLQQGIVSPVDGQLTQYGDLQQGQMLQVKGKHFSLDELIGETPQFLDGCYSVIYLSPGNYHRFHAPFNLQLEKIRYIPGTLLATSSASLAREARVYCRNERMVLSGNSMWGPFYFVAVGATAVGHICLSGINIKTNQPFTKEKVVTNPLPESIQQGDELGYFALGSTIVLAVGNQSMVRVPFPAYSNTQSSDNQTPRIRMGESLWR
ncbi:phosphatidylserine decarboxylase [Candidatus Endobugula sertula]|uniref:phosphatidylserine decarboxylase n=1 Tax=Candidatus Endobugula sertula TaxID=62101 RepID=A0A1D2QQL2_9GAMM|nr:phosphatidylserine decarboxylase [Candidatus Endobugula sertula]